MNDPANQLTHDAFLGGRLRVWQPKSGFRAGVDAVLLAAAVPIRGGQSALELGAGVAVASLCLAERVAGVSVVAVEKQSAYAALRGAMSKRRGPPRARQCRWWRPILPNCRWRCVSAALIMC